MSIPPYIILSSDFEDVGTDSSASVFVLASPAHMSTSDTKSEPFEDVDSPTVVLDYVLDSDTNTETKPTEEDPRRMIH
ncbi:hypothetical protein Tco_1485094 [Tanacetum coccineum]